VFEETKALAQVHTGDGKVCFVRVRRGSVESVLEKFYCLDTPGLNTPAAMQEQELSVYFMSLVVLNLAMFIESCSVLLDILLMSFYWNSVRKVQGQMFIADKVQEA